MSKKNLLKETSLKINTKRIMNIHHQQIMQKFHSKIETDILSYDFVLDTELVYFSLHKNCRSPLSYCDLISNIPLFMHMVFFLHCLWVTLPKNTPNIKFRQAFRQFFTDTDWHATPDIIFLQLFLMHSPEIHESFTENLFISFLHLKNFCISY